ncbi:unnamed protein product [Dovyalis caffra]|uniref:Uncharacterized protein n=1 Tax=Dovyalis caffra TaxID=77055 RepID=A0AAV1RM55_9ROSI|nr:unnamed protein product [Dovyalis caffra]
MAIGHRRSLISPPPSTAELHSKFTKLVYRHEQLKISYQQLKSQINTGLLQAEEVFASLAIPLMKLVGLKTVEMVNEGRFSTIIIDDDLNHRNGSVPGGARDRNGQISAFEGENFAARAAIAGKELVEKRKMQFTQLVKLLRQIETHVNSSQDEILQNLDNHHGFLKTFFQKSICLVSTLDSENHDTVVITVNLLQAIFHHVITVLGSVKDGVEDLIQGLSQQMCNPMVEYVKGLKDDMKNGTCMRLLAMVDEMEKKMKDGRVELEDARKKVRLAEEGKIEAACKLNETIERVRKMKEQLRSLSEAKRGLIKSSFSQKVPALATPTDHSAAISFRKDGQEENQTKDDKLLWEILKKKRKHQVPESPLRPEVLSYFSSTKEHRKSKGVRRAGRSCTTGLSPQTPFLNALIPLGSSPSAVNQPVVSSRHIAP